MSEQKPYEYDMTYGAMKNYFRAAERVGQHLTGYIISSPASFTAEYSQESRTYAVSSDNKAFQPIREVIPSMPPLWTAPIRW